MSKTRISYSAVNAFKECPTKYYNSKKFTMKDQASAFAFGAAVESGVNKLLEGKTLAQALRTFKDEWLERPANRFEGAKPILDNPEVFYYGSDLDTDLLTEADKKFITKQWLPDVAGEKADWEEVLDGLQKILKDGSSLKPEEREYVNRVTWLTCRRRGMHLVKGFKEQILPQIEEVISLQKEISIPNKDGDRVTGYIDLILKIKGIDKPVIFDLKTAGRPYELHNLVSSDQLRIYAAAEGLTHIGYIVLIKSIRQEKSCDSCKHVRENGRLTKCAKCSKGRYTVANPKVNTQILTKQITDVEVADVLHDFSDILVAIKNEVRWKNPNSCNNYGTKCEYYDACWGGKKLEDLEHLKRR